MREMSGNHYPKAIEMILNFIIFREVVSFTEEFL